MTLMLVRVRDADEAVAAAQAGVDAVELAINGVSGLAIAGTVRDAVPGLILRLRIGTGALAGAADDAPAGEIAIVLDPVLDDVGGAPATLHDRLAAKVAIVRTPPASGDSFRRLGRFKTIMLDTGDTRRLIDAVEIARLDAFALACRSEGLRFGFAGGLEAPDVARLLLLRPDVLGFDRAVRHGHDLEGALDTAALEAIRALIPREHASSAPASRGRRVTDRIFVRDFVVPLVIGAYQAEHGVRQRVRFGVEAEIVREAAAPRDMRDVFSYDVIIETIRVLSERAHVTFVETLAEEVAASLLVYAELASVRVTVEKLDVIDGTVGIEITRERMA